MTDRWKHLHFRSKAAEIYTALYYTQHQQEVLFPMGNQRDWDLLVQEGDTWKTVQVKSVQQKANGAYTVGMVRMAKSPKTLRTKRVPAYAPGAFDYLSVVDPDTGNIWILPAAESTGVTSIALRPPTHVIPACNALQRVNTVPKKLYAWNRNTRIRERWAGQLPPDRPADISEQTWTMLQAHVEGAPVTVIARQANLDVSTVSGRLERACWKLEHPNDWARAKERSTAPLRRHFGLQTLDNKPERVSDESWAVFKEYVHGTEPISVMAKRLGRSKGTLKERLYRVAFALGYKQVSQEFITN